MRSAFGRTVLGAALIVVGVLWLAARFSNFSIGHYGWPLFIIVPGVLIFLLAFEAGSGAGVGLAIAGSLITVTGLLLAVQNATDYYQSWAYAWALIAPGSIGLGLFLYGTLRARPDLVRAGTRAALVGLGLFVLGAFFFEGLIGLGGRRFGAASGVGISALVVALGLALLIANVVGRRSG